MAAKIAVIDSQVAGIAGDMLMASLVDAGANKAKVIDAIFACQDFLKGSKVTKADFAKVMAHGFSATQLQMKYTDSVHERKGTEALLRHAKPLGAATIVEEALKIASEVCIYTNDHITVLEIDAESRA